MTFLRRLLVGIKFRFWGPLRANRFHGYRLSHSLFGEDMVVRSLLGNRKDGFYVDVGAHHPVFDSNTYHLYNVGWKGINIDAAPGSMVLFRVLRPRDANLEVCISTGKKKEVFYLFDSAEYNTVDPEMAERAQLSGRILKGTCEVEAATLDSILDEYLPSGTHIDYLNIDIEGLDEVVLQSMDWQRYRPSVISFEHHVEEIKDLREIPVIRFLNDKGYRFEGKCGSTFIVSLLKP
jgi:FkbM family methyltransferase